MDPELREQIARVLSSMEMVLPKPVPAIDWGTTIAANWKRHSFGGYLEPLLVDEKNSLPFDDLFGIDAQKRVVDENTRQFLRGYPSNNILLWGTRGTGKSSLVRSLLLRYHREGLRVIQVEKDDLVSLPAITDSIRDLPYRFILFADDVSFETGESSYKMLKSALDGAVYGLPENARIYVTSNRRHLLPEYETDNRGAMLVNNEIHHGEAVEEKISLSGRFGIWVGFHPFNQRQYLEVVRLWIARLCRNHGIEPLWSQQIADAAESWSQAKGDRSGRIALQFATDWVGHYLLERSRDYE
ncbi:MAG: ATP-binding protein [Desulfuromonadia bacterium]